MSGNHKIHFWIKARAHFKAAKEIQKLNDEEEAPRYAALRLRMALECLAYDSAQSANLSYDDMKIWQPGNAIKNLKNMDPLVDQSRTISSKPKSIEECGSVKPESIGSDVRLSARRMDKLNNKLGQLLHEASLYDHVSRRAIQSHEVTKRVNEVIQEMEAVFSGENLKIHVGENANLPCDCGHQMTRRVSALIKDQTVWCDECDASHLAVKDNGLWKVKRRTVAITCPRCEQEHTYPALAERDGTVYRCATENCNSTFKCSFGLHWSVE
ncbi:hypothetical protein [Tritonibacter scottomollicae]|uniref:hypothetical protein n=1 Tax=Tritonibacter scottomollicae TaxID=483013 RepID=UPI003AA7F1FF